METITQTKLSEALGVDPAFLCKVLKGYKRPTSARALALESASGVGRMTWLYAKPCEIRRELERVFGKINFKRGRLPGRREVKK